MVSTHQPALQERFLLALSFVRACRKWPPCRREGFWALTIPSLLTPSIFHSGICQRIRGKDTPVFLGYPGGSAGKESAYYAGDLGSIPGLRRSPGEGKGYLLPYSGLENSMDCRVHGVAKSGTWLSDLHFHFHFQEKRNQEFLLGSRKLASTCQGLRTLNSYYLFPCCCSWVLLCVSINPLAGPLQLPLLCWGLCGCLSPPLCPWFQGSTPYRRLLLKPITLPSCSPGQGSKRLQSSSCSPGSICPVQDTWSEQVSLLRKHLSWYRSDQREPASWRSEQRGVQESEGQVRRL